MPPIVVGGMSPAAIARAAAYADDWFLLPVPPAMAADGVAQLAAEVADRGRPLPAITASVMTLIDDDPTVPDQAARPRLVDPDGLFGMPASPPRTWPYG